MRKVILKKFWESFVSVIPIVIIVIILSLCSVVSFTKEEAIAFLVCGGLLVVGIALFNLGADLAMTPMGEHIGAGLTKLKSLALLLGVCLAMGILITIAEPDLAILAEQVGSSSLIVTVGVGVGIFLVIAILKIIFRKSLSSLLMFFYMLLFAMSALLILFGKENLMPLAFDSGGVTTGPITVPFIMALGVGIATTLGGKNSGENSFGLIALCSIGPMLAVMILGFTTSDVKGDPSYGLEPTVENIINVFLTTAKEAALALGMIVIFFVILQIVCLKLPKKKLIQIAIGITYTFFGLVIFLSAVKIGFMPIGYKLGMTLAENKILLCVVSFVMGLVVVLAEPAVHVLNKQVEAITEGTVKRGSMMIALSCGVGLSILLSVIRIIFGFNILFYLIPGYMISLGLSFFVPKLYTAIAFDSGGVASGPLTSTFILPFAVGACYGLGGEPLSDAFGIVAMVAMAPLITIQLLGFKSVIQQKLRRSAAMKQILNADDEQIIDFM